MVTYNKISIIMPTYNHAQFLKESIGSVLNQTYTDYELIIINNFSTDNTLNIIKSFKDERIRVLNYDNNGIIAKSRNYAISLTNAPYIAFLDSDDIWYSNKLKKTMEILDKNKDIDVAWHKLNVYGSNKTIKKGKFLVNSKSFYEDLLFKGNFLSLSAAALKREKIAEVEMFSEGKDFISSEDYDLWLKLAKKNNNFYFIEETLGEYRIHDNNITTQNIEMHSKNMLNVIGKHFLEFEGKDKNRYKKLLKKRRASIFSASGRFFQINNNFKSSLIFYGKALKEYPFYIKSYLGIFFTIVQCLKTKILYVSHL